MRTFVTLAALAVHLVGCIGTATPDGRLQDEFGSEDDGPEHNPGTPCGLCHGEFFMSGTIYTSDLAPDGIDEHGRELGVSGVQVIVTDFLGRDFEAVTNPAGNFYFELSGNEGGFRIEDEGKTKLGFEPEYPLNVRIVDGAIEQEMITPIRAEGSCAYCHDGDPAADSSGRVYLVETP